MLMRTAKQWGSNESIGYEKNARLTIFNNADRWVHLITVRCLAWNL